MSFGNRMCQYIKVSLLVLFMWQSRNTLKNTIANIKASFSVYRGNSHNQLLYLWRKKKGANIVFFFFPQKNKIKLLYTTNMWMIQHSVALFFSEVATFTNLLLCYIVVVFSQRCHCKFRSKILGCFDRLALIGYKQFNETQTWL